MLHSFGCKQESARFCLACGTVVCGCQGTARGQCPACYRGLLAGYYLAGDRKCGYAGCNKAAVAASPRVGHACLHHALEKGGYKFPAPDQVRAYEHAGRPASGVDATVRRLFANREEWERPYAVARELCGGAQ